MQSSVEIKVYESTKDILTTLRSSEATNGVLYDTSKKPREVLTAGYSRGQKELASLLTKRFSPILQQKWFEDRGVQFNTRQDGSMVVVVDGTSDITCSTVLFEESSKLASIETTSKVTAITKKEDTGEFQLVINHHGDERVEHCDYVILATGNSHLGHQIVRSLGHTVSKTVRSCFDLRLEDNTFDLEEGTICTLPQVRLSFKVNMKGQKRPRVFKSEGTAQVECRNGAVVLKGMATQSLTSLAAFALQQVAYKGQVLLHFCPDVLDGKVEEIEAYLWQYRQDNPSKLLQAGCPLLHHYIDYNQYDWETEAFVSIKSECIATEIWRSLAIAYCGASKGSAWGNMSPKKIRMLAETIVGCPIEFIGRYNTDSSAFINAGGVVLNEVNMSTMQSKVVDNLFCCGQVLDGDANHISYSNMRDFAMGLVAAECVVDTINEATISTE